MKRIVAAVAIGQLVGQLGWIDPLFIPLVIVGPMVTGALAARRGMPVSLPAVMWFSAGISMLWSDWVVNHSDVGFHAGLSVVMAGLTSFAWAVVRLASRNRGAGIGVRTSGGGVVTNVGLGKRWRSR